MRPITSSGAWLVAASIASTRFSVGRTIGRKSVHLDSSNNARKFLFVSRSTKRGVLRS